MVGMEDCGKAHGQQITQSGIIYLATVTTYSST